MARDTHNTSDLISAGTARISASFVLSSSFVIRAFRVAADCAAAATPPGTMLVRPVALTSAAWIAAASLHSTGFFPAVRTVASSASPMVIPPPPMPISWTREDVSGAFLLNCSTICKQFMHFISIINILFATECQT